MVSLGSRVPRTRDTTNITRNTKNRILAARIDVPASVVKPKRADTSATTKKSSAQRSMAYPPVGIVLERTIRTQRPVVAIGSHERVSFQSRFQKQRTGSSAHNPASWNIKCILRANSPHARSFTPGSSFKERMILSLPRLSFLRLLGAKREQHCSHIPDTGSARTGV